MQDTVTLTPTEALIAKMWQEFFDLVDIDLDADFFDLGGNSLTAIKFLSRIDQAFGPGTLSAETLFASGRLQDIAYAIDQKNAK